MRYPGSLITIEGIDNAGKTTQVTRLVNYFLKRGKLAVSTKELTSPIGPYIREGLYAKSFSPFLKTYLFATDRAIRYEHEVIPALKAGKLVFADRWSISAIVYRGFEGFDIEFVKAVNSKIPPADITIILDLPAAVSIQRGLEAKKPCPYNRKQLEEAQKRYLAHALDYNSVVIDATQSTGEVFEQILAAIRDSNVSAV